MWIVRLALNKPYTFIVSAILILVLGFTSIATTPTDIFPNIDIPVVTVIWSYSGLPAKEMEQRVTTFSEFVMAVVNDVKSIDSQTVNGASVIKISFQPQVRIDAAMSQVGAAVNSIRFRMPPGVNPPWILRFSASTVPVIQLSLSSDTLSESEIYDYGLFRVRQQLTTVPGTLLPTPYGGVARQIMVDLDQDALLAKGITPIDVTAAINAQNVTLPSGTAKVGTREYTVSTNSSPVDALMLNDVPIKTVNGSLVYMRDVAHVRDGWSVQQNVARANGKPAALLTIMKTGSVSTLDIVNQIKNDVLPGSRAAAPKGLKITELFDQSIFVKASIVGVLREGVIAASLTALMILLFLGSSAVHPEFNHCAERNGRNDEHDDARRSCAGYRHPCGRCHRNHRKHSSSHGLAATAGSRFDRCRRDRYTHAGLNSDHMYRLRFSRLSHWAGKVSIHADGICGGLRHARFLCSIEDTSSRVGELHAGCGA